MQHHDVNELRKFGNRCWMQQAECAVFPRLDVLDYHFKRRMMNIIPLDIRVATLSHPEQQCHNLLQIVVCKQVTILRRLSM